MEQLDFRRQGFLPNRLVYCDSFLWLGWHANLWVSNEWWLKQSSRPSAFQLWYITFCPPVTHFESMYQDKRALGGKKCCQEKYLCDPVVIWWLTDCYSVLNVSAPPTKGLFVKHLKHTNMHKWKMTSIMKLNLFRNMSTTLLYNSTNRIAWQLWQH